MGQVGSKPQKLISTKWTPQLAYAVGLIATDGYLSKDGRHIDFTSQDIEQVRTFKKCLGLKNIKIGLKTSGSSKKLYPRIQFGDINFYRWLQKIGLTTKKSLVLSSLNIPNKYFFDFLRGCFDGDGSMFAFWDKRWHSSYMFYLSFASGSAKHLQWLQTVIRKLANVSGSIKLTKNCYQLVFAKKETKILFKKMFYKDGLPRLKRKFIKAQKIFKTDNLHNNAQVEKFGRLVRLRALCQQ